MGAPKQPLDCHERALRLLAVRPRSRDELRSRLLRAGFGSEEVEHELGRLEAVGLVDDEAFARAVLEHEVTIRRSGRRAVLERLRVAGVDRAMVATLLEEAGAGDEGERAVELARSRLGRLASLPVDRAFPRLVSFLARRGYDAATARQAARTALGVDGTEA